MILRPSVRVGPNGKLCLSNLASCTLSFVAIRFKKGWAHEIRRVPSRKVPPVDTSNSTDAKASLGGAAEWQTRHICSQFAYSTHVVCLECEVSGSALCEQRCRKLHCAMCSMRHVLNAACART